ncbi:hypothetical protein BBJ28_00026351 [Nothophytophthora sp. Chile5]|nr:hypothetical protein BBJ28_00026433 [Nothophytophthora sp. Chile5]RLN70435.1 hypothetical protein BBJ28_00026259 [Nothophytophthora sp. Chile5]RLN87197.1 hypothetical protein BBJ28_00025725 [Nothophytophthora sp. Chile5]RLN97219.1 hypothetical protein BBJ28_00026351 [Nothophytophthora sp. Chile5]
MQAAGLADLRDKEKAAEAVFFKYGRSESWSFTTFGSKEDEKTLRKLLQKMKGQTDVNDKKGLKDHVEHDKKGLGSIPGLDLSEEQVQALLKWKHHQ